MPLTVTRRAGRGNVLTIDGTVNGRRIQKRAASDNFGLATEEAAVLEARLLRESWHGPRKGQRAFSEAIISYCDAAPARPAPGNVCAASLRRSTTHRSGQSIKIR
jgi:hypothetical protein